MRKKRMILNTTTSLLHQIIVVICGFILPKLFLRFYGSSVNGLVSSITQFLGFISMLELGVGSVVQSALYEPLSKKDTDEISKILSSARKFFKNIARVFVLYTVLLMVLYPIITIESFDYVFTLSLIFIIAISSFAQYYFGIVYQLLLNADQRGYVQLIIQTGTLVLNTIVCAILMYAGANIIWVKIMTSVIYIARPLLLALYTKKHYHIDWSIKYDEEPIKQKWNGLAQHIASVVLNNTDVAVLTVFSTLANVSIYTVYYNVVYGVRQIVFSLTAGIQSLLGNMYARKEYELLNQSFGAFEWILHTVVVLVFSCTAVLIIPFVRIYTFGINDAEYIVPLFGLLMTLAQTSYCIRLPYNIMVLAAGHYKQTQTSAIVEMLINIILSVVFVFRYGIIGVAIGTIAAMLYRTIYFARYLSKAILFRKFTLFIKQVIVDIVSFLLCVFLGGIFVANPVNYIEWAYSSGKVLIVVILITGTVNFIVYRKQMFAAYKFLLRRDNRYGASK